MAVKKTKKVPTESQEQQRFVLKLRWLWPDIEFFAVPNGGKRGKGEARQMQLEGVEKGTPDMFIAEPMKGFYGLFLEFKRADKSLSVTSTEQSVKIRKLEEKGYKCLVVYGAVHAYKELMMYLDIKE